MFAALLALGSGLWDKIKGPLIWVGGALVAVGAVFVAGRESGKSSSDTENANARTKEANQVKKDIIHDVGVRNEIENNIAGSPPGDSGRVLRDEWSRD